MESVYLIYVCVARPYFQSSSSSVRQQQQSSSLFWDSMCVELCTFRCVCALKSRITNNGLTNVSWNLGRSKGTTISSYIP